MLPDYQLGGERGECNCITLAGHREVLLGNDVVVIRHQNCTLYHGDQVQWTLDIITSLPHKVCIYIYNLFVNGFQVSLQIFFLRKFVITF